MIEVTVLGGQDLRDLARGLREASATLDRELVSGIRRAVAPLGRDIKAGVGRYTPSGYTPVLSSTLRTSTSVRRTRMPGVSIRVSAKGRVSARDVNAVDRGVLAHPVFGNRDVWTRQRIRAGFVSDPFGRLQEPVLRSMAEAAEAVLEKAARS